jgi:hypothetical protein
MLQYAGRFPDMQMHESVSCANGRIAALEKDMLLKDANKN